MEQLINNMELYLKGSLIMSFVAAFTGGLMVSFTPCVYPMIPVTASYVGGKNIGGSKTKGFIFSITYVLGMAITYALLGVFAASTGRLFGEMNTNPLTFFIIANVMIILGLGMLDVFQVPMLSPKNIPSSGGMLGVFIVGMASGMVSGPCTAPVLGVLLTYVASSQNIAMGAGLLFVFALGMGLILILVGTFSGLVTALPRSGEWMVKVKKGIGLLMIITGEYFLIKTGQFIL